VYFGDLVTTAISLAWILSFSYTTSHVIAELSTVASTKEFEGLDGEYSFPTHV
jgi:hypothetical protein